jgi:hypothetical protein
MAHKKAGRSGGCTPETALADREIARRPRGFAHSIPSRQESDDLGSFHVARWPFHTPTDYLALALFLALLGFAAYSAGTLLGAFLAALQ